MGFLDGLRKMMQGKPVFEDPNAVKPEQTVSARDQLDASVLTQTNPPPSSVRMPGQTRQIPTFDLQHCQSHTDGSNMTVTIWATNTSNVDIEIDKCVILEKKCEVDRRLTPGQAHEVTLYSGPIPITDYAHKANIFYRSIQENEYFRADFMVEYNHESDGTFTIEDLHPEHYAIKDLSRSGLL